MAAMSLTDAILTHALSLGFDRAAAMPVGAPRYRAEFEAWLAAGYHGDLAYLAARAAERLNPQRWAPDARSIIVLAATYGPGSIPSEGSDPAHGRIARYAWRQDYHDVIKPKLYALDAFIRERTGRQTPGKVFVDSAPVLERDFAEQAGLGFIGRNCCLITPGLGSWTVLAGLMAPEELTMDHRAWTMPPQGIVHGCGRCTRCLDVCPTRAFAGPHVLDARRCISYLTIELRGPIPPELRPSMGNRVFGCDACQEVCPYNKQVSVDRIGFVERGDDSKPDTADRQRSRSIPLSELLALDEAVFRERFRGTPVLRAKRRGLVRNVCVAAGNSGDPELVPALRALLADPEPLVREHAAWAVQRIEGARFEREEDIHAA